MHIQSTRFKLLSTVLALLLAISPEMLAQQSAAQQPATQPQNGQSTTDTANPGAASGQTQTPPVNGTQVNPSQPPLAPVTTYPSANDNPDQQQPASTDNQKAATPPEAPQPKQQPSQPVGAATAERVPTAGGAAAKPAGAAIAPAKQNQTRSLLIKIGAIAAAGAAAGTIYALSRGTPSTPPNAAAGIPK